MASRIFITLSVFMIVVSIVSTFVRLPYGDGDGWPALTTYRDPRSGLHILNHGAIQVPRWFYRGFKGLTSALWCILIPLQHNERLRKRRNLHRVSGYIAAALSIERGAAGYWMMFMRWTTTADFLHIHMLYGIPLPGFAWLSFDAALVPLGIFFYGSMFRMIAAARAKRFDAHRRWATIHSKWGYAIAIERGLAILVYCVGWLLYLMPNSVQAFLPQDEESKLRSEVSSLAWTLTTSGIIVMVWTRSLGKAKKV